MFLSKKVGLWYALSQGVLAKQFIKMSGEDPTVVLLICVAGLSIGRVFAMLTTSIVMVRIQYDLLLSIQFTHDFIDYISMRLLSQKLVNQHAGVNNLYHK